MARRAGVFVIAFATAAGAWAAAADDGWKAYLSGDYAKSRTLCQGPADAGDASCQVLIGNLYLFGQTVGRDYATAEKYFRKAANQGNSGGEQALGWLYQNGWGVEKDLDKAYHWYKISADKGNQWGENGLGWLYANGFGVKQDYGEAMKWFHKSADQGLTTAQDGIAFLYYGGFGVEQDYEQAAKWSKKPAEEGDADAQQRLAWLYYNGWGVKQDYAEALKWSKKSADQGNQWGENVLATLYYNGAGVPKDYAEAAKWWRKSADQGNQWGEFSLADLYFFGYAGLHDDAEMDRLYEDSAKQGNPYAPNGIGYSLRVGRGVPKNFGQALKWLRTGVERGDLSNSATNLAAMYENGEGVTQDYVEAYKWYLIGAAHENPYAPAGVERLKALMTKEQVAEAQKLAAAFDAEGHAPAQAAAPAAISASAPPQSPAAAAAPKAISSDVDSPPFQLKPSPERFAVVVGVEKYKDLPDSQFAERDADAMRKTLLALGWPERNVVLLEGSQATIAGLKKYLEEWLPRNAGPGSTVFFYFAGHGAPDVESGDAFIVPWDGDASYLKSTAYPVKKLYAALGALKARSVWVALDACFSGAGGRSVLAKDARPLVTKLNPTGILSGKLTAFSAASGGQITSTMAEEGHGAFTYYFLKGVDGAAKSSSGAVTAKGLMDYLLPNVEDAARRENREQTPLLQGADRELARF